MTRLSQKFRLVLTSFIRKGSPSFDTVIRIVSSSFDWAIRKVSSSFDSVIRTVTSVLTRLSQKFRLVFDWSI